MKNPFGSNRTRDEGGENLSNYFTVFPESTNTERSTPNVFFKNTPGFTLLELLISIAIVGIMVFILMAVLRLGFRSVEAGEKKIESLGRVKASLNLIDAQIQSEIPLTFDESGERKYFFKGQSDSLEFSSNYSIWGGEKGYVIVTYQVIEGEQGKRTLQASENTVGRENRKAIKLLEFFNEMSFEYYYQDPTEEEGKWIKEWTETAFLPQKIRLHLVKDGKDLSLMLPMKTLPMQTGGALVTAQKPAPVKR
jgi:prepilin-type N-terminal cleavage/methylation domain-containing protein